MQDLLNDETKLIWRRALLPVALVQFVLPLLPALGIGSPFGTLAGGEFHPPEMPPGPFFLIWLVIFAAYLGFALWAWLDDTPATRLLALPFLLTGLFSSTWMILEQSGAGPAISFPVLTALAGSSFVAAHRFNPVRGVDGNPGRLAGEIASGLLAGWMCLATAIAVSGLVRGAFGLGSTDAVWQMLSLTLAITALLAWFGVSRVTQSPYFLLAHSWGLAGLVVNLWWTTHLHVPAVITGLFGIWLVRRNLRSGASKAKNSLR